MTEPAPQYLPAEHVETFQRYRRLANLFDQAFRIPGTRWRFGLDALLGLIPGGGDLVAAAFAVYGIALARRMGAPAGVQVRMLGNVALDALGGAIPVVGDLFDIAFKAHVRNGALLERWLERPEKVQRASRISVVVSLVGAALAIVLSAALTVWAVRALADALSR